MKYNGHKNWNHWNVSLWLFNTENLYDQMCWEVSISRTLDEAARGILTSMQRYRTHQEGLSWYYGNPTTPDGAPYTFTSIRAALVNWDK